MLFGRLVKIDKRMKRRLEGIQKREREAAAKRKGKTRKSSRAKQLERREACA